MARYKYRKLDFEGGERLLYIFGGILLFNFLIVVFGNIFEGKLHHIRECLSVGGIFLFPALLFLVPAILMTVYRKAYEAASRRESYLSALNRLPEGLYLSEIQRLPQGHAAKKAMSSYNSCYDLLVRYPSREALEYIHTYNPKACRELVSRLRTILGYQKEKSQAQNPEGTKIHENVTGRDIK